MTGAGAGALSGRGAGGVPLRLGTRRSALARAQSRAVAARLESLGGRPVELVDVTTEGDVSRAALVQIGGTGVFVNALRDALLAGRVDLAVHSLKDLPTAPPRGLVLAAIPTREDPRDALVASGGRTLADLPPGARVGTGSPRRAAQLRAARPDLLVEPVRGNVDTRLAMVASGRLDAVVLARAGLARLGRLEAIIEVLDPAVVLPAPGQGALAVECRADDAETRALLAPLDDALTRACVTAERVVLATLEAGCTAPVGALAQVTAAAKDGEPVIRLDVVVASPDGRRNIRETTGGPVADAAGLARRLALELLDQGVSTLMEEPVP